MNIKERTKKAYNAFINKDPVNPSRGKVITSSLATYKTPYYDESQIYPYNPDKLVQKKGLEIYDDMQHDEQIKASYILKKFFILAKGFEIEPASEDKKDIEMADFIDFAFNDGFKKEFNKSLGDILDALQYGFSVSEKIYKIIATGQYKGMIGLEDLRSRPPHSFEFHIDNKGDLLYLIQHQEIGQRKLPQDKFLIYTYRSKFGGWYGTSDFRDAYRSWFIKDKLVRYEAIYLERFGIPIISGTYPQGASADDIGDLETALKNVQAKTVLTMPDNFNINIHEVVKGGEKAFESSISRHNTMISRAFLLPELLGYTDHDTGSQALGREQFDLYYIYLESIQRQIEDSVNDSLIKQLINFNYMGVDAYPKIKIKKLSEEDKSVLYPIWIEAVSKGVIKTTIDDENLIRKEFGFQEREETEEEKNGIVPEVPPANNPTEEPKKEEEVEFTQNFAEVKLSRDLTEYEKKVDFAKVNNDLVELTVDLATDLGRTVNKIENSILNDIDNKNIIEKKDFNAVNNLKINPVQQKGLVKTFQKNFNKDFRRGSSTAKEELTKKAQFKESDNIGTFAPVEAINYLKNKAFSVAGTEEEFILKNVKNLLASGMKNGKTENEIVFELEEFFEQYKVQQKVAIPQGLGKPVKITTKAIESITGRLHTVARTNVSDAYNQGRMALYNSPDVKDFVAALQYSAILDSNTTDFCRTYDKKIYKSNDPIWNSVVPPNHFNCRSITVPVLDDEEFKESKKVAIKQPVTFGGTA